MERNKYIYSIGYFLPTFPTLKKAREFASMLIETGDDRVSFFNIDDFGTHYIVRNPYVISDKIDLSTKYYPVDKNFRGLIIKDGFWLYSE